MSSQPTNELNEHMRHWEENSWVVVFFRFFESGSLFFSFSLPFACSAVRKWRPCFVLFFNLFRYSESAIRGHQFIAFREIVNFPNTIYFRQHKCITKLLLTTQQSKVY